MYTSFYQLKEKPFEIAPDPHFLYLSESHREALAHLVYAVKERKGFTVITGEVGTGKTTLIQTLLGRLDGTTRTAYVFNPNLGCTDFLHYVCEDFGLRGQNKSKGQYIARLHTFLLECYAKNENVILIVDEAQNLDPKLLEEVRLLTNLETPKKKLLQVILVGQPELDRILGDSQFRQLKQRISLRYQMKLLGKEETKKYITYRLLKAGAAETRLFTPKALDRIYRYSKGIPRVVNIVCDNALLSGYAADQKLIGDRIVREVIENLEGGKSQNRKTFHLGVWSAALILGLLGLFFLWRLDFRGAFETEWTQWIERIRVVLQKIF
jgi:general secretion pathway protein A